VSENLDIVAILTDDRLFRRSAKGKPQVSFPLLRCLAACIKHHQQPATVAELAKVAQIPERTLKYQLAILRCAGVVTAPVGKNRLSLITVHNPDRWDHNRAVHLGTPEPSTPDPTPTPAAPSIPDEPDQFTAPILQGQTLPANVTRDYAAEVKILDSHPIVRGKIKLSWLAHLERKYAVALQQRATTLEHLASSFIHEFLGKPMAIASRRLADPKTDWEWTFENHVCRFVDPVAFGKRWKTASPTATSVKFQQKKFQFGQRRPANPSPPPTARPSVPAADPQPTLKRLGATTSTAAALANPVLAHLLKGVAHD